MSLNATRTRRLNHALDTLWYVLSAPHVTAALFVLLALLLALAAAFPQAPTGLEAAEAERWLTATASRYPGAGAFLRSVGAFDLLHSPWMQALLALLAFNLALRVAAQMRFLSQLRRMTAPPLPPQRVISRRATLPGPLADAVAQLRTALGPGYDTIRVESDATRAQIFAQRRPVGALGPLLVYAGLLLIVIGVAVESAIGWRAADIALAPGNSTTLNRPGAPQLTLNDLAGDGATVYPNVSLVYMGAGRSLRPSSALPARWGNLWLAQQATGSALAITAADTNSNALVIQALGPDDEIGPTVHILFQQTQNEQGFAIPARNLTFRAVSYPALPEQGITGPVFLVEAYRGDDASPAATALVEDVGSLTVENVTLTLRRDRYIILQAAYLPGLLPVLLGGLLVLAGVLMMSAWGLARVWVHMAQDGEHVLLVIGATGPAAPQAEIERLLDTARRPGAPTTEVADAN